MSIGTITNDFLGMFGVKGAGIGYMIDSMPLIGSSHGQLQNLYDMYVETMMGQGTGPIQRMMSQQMMGMGGMMMPGMAFGMPSPMAMGGMMAPFCGCGYAGGSQQIDFAAGSFDIPGLNWLSGNRRAGRRFERMLRTNPQARAAFEAQIGGRIVDFGFRNEGKVRIQRFGGGYNPAVMMANPMAAGGLGYMGGMQSAVMGMGGAFGLGGMMGGMGMGGMGMFGAGSMFGNPFMAMTGMGMANIAGMQGPAGGGYSNIDNSGIFGGRGAGSWNPNAMPGQINNTNPYYENYHQQETAALLADPSLTVEDKVTLLIMLIMKKMDRDIERQAQYVNSIQQQQSKRNSGAKGAAGGGAGKGAAGPFEQNPGSSSPSIDVETMKLKRMIDKRSQMFDMLRQIIDKYNETAKGMIQSIGR